MKQYLSSGEKKLGEVRPSPLYLLFFLLIAIVIACAGHDLLYYNRYIQRDPSIEGGALIIITIFTWLFSFAAISTLKKVIWSTPVILITNLGVWFDVALRQPFFIPWKDITDISYRKVTPPKPSNRSYVTKVNCLTFTINFNDNVKRPKVMKTSYLVRDDLDRENQTINFRALALQGNSKKAARMIKEWKNISSN